MTDGLYLDFNTESEEFMIYRGTEVKKEIAKIILHNGRVMIQFAGLLTLSDYEVEQAMKIKKGNEEHVLRRYSEQILKKVEVI